jgi:hypothetical protein
MPNGVVSIALWPKKSSWGGGGDAPFVFIIIIGVSGHTVARRTWIEWMWSLLVDQGWLFAVVFDASGRDRARFI